MSRTAASNDHITVTAFKLQAADGVVLAATRFELVDHNATGQDGIGRDCPVTVISSAAAVPQGYYAAFARALAARGGPVYTYDYRGVGGSLTGPLKTFQTTMRAWGQLDARAMAEMVHERHPDRPLHWVGQSYGGGFAVGLNPANHLIARHLGIAVPHGYYREMDGFDRFKVGLLMGIGVPVACALFGYLPGKRLGFGEDLPKGAALEWRDWILSRNSMWDTIPASELAPYEAFTAPMCFLRFTDDPWATDIGTGRIAAAFTAVRDQRVIRLSPSDAGGHAVGHLGFFRPRFAATLWPLAFAWLDGRSLAGCSSVVA
jgi:predicted alpha/beta hydrolase